MFCLLHCLLLPVDGHWVMEWDDDGQVWFYSLETTTSVTVSIYVLSSIIFQFSLNLFPSVKEEEEERGE